MTDETRENLVRDYVEEILDTCDMGFLLECTTTYLEQNLSEYSDEQLLEEIREYYPHLLGEE